MAAGNIDIMIEQGATFQMRFRLKDAAGSGIDLSDSVFTGQVRKSIKDSDTVAEFSFVKDDQSASATRGWVTALLTDEQTRDIPVDVSEAENCDRPDADYIYDIEREYGPSGFVERVLEGCAMISPEVTR